MHNGVGEGPCFIRDHPVDAIQASLVRVVRNGGACAIGAMAGVVLEKTTQQE